MDGGIIAVLIIFIAVGLPITLGILGPAIKDRIRNGGKIADEKMNALYGRINTLERRIENIETIVTRHNNYREER